MVVPRETGALVAAVVAGVATAPAAEATAAGAVAGASSAGADRGSVLLRVKRPAGSAGGRSALLPGGRSDFLGASTAAVATGLAAFLVVVLGMRRRREDVRGKVLLLSASDTLLFVKRAWERYWVVSMCSCMY